MKINNIEITGLASDSRKVKPGFAFFAINGRDENGEQYIDAARAAGATVIVTGEEYEGDSFKVPNVRLFLAECAWQFYQPVVPNLIGVTGTAGKTSVVHFCRYILENLGKDVASLGTLGLIRNGEAIDVCGNGQNVPEPIILASTLHDLYKQGCEYVAMEASSQGLMQERVGAVPIKVAGFTNLTPEHIGPREHADFAEYKAAKQILFNRLLVDGGVSVLNADDEHYPDFITPNKKIMTYGKNGADIKLMSIEATPEFQKVTIAVHGQIYQYKILAAGDYQVWNSMCAIGMVMGLKFDISDIVRAIENAPSPEGRIELVGITPKGGSVYIDHSHTGKQIETTLKSMRPTCKGRLIVMIAPSGGRPHRGEGLGKAANKFADVVYVTDDCPRFDEPNALRETIREFCPNMINAGGRKEAILRAVADLENGDVLLIANKGREPYVEIQGVRHPWSDFDTTKEAIGKLK